MGYKFYPTGNGIHVKKRPTVVSKGIITEEWPILSKTYKSWKKNAELQYAWKCAEKSRDVPYIEGLK